MSQWLWIAGLYAIASTVTLALFAFDKRAARLDRRRVPERTLHLCELCGGWPGALMGMRLVRHKRQKGAYLLVFWCIVVLHAVAWTAWAMLR